MAASVLNFIYTIDSYTKGESKMSERILLFQLKSKDLPDCFSNSYELVETDSKEGAFTILRQQDSEIKTILIQMDLFQASEYDIAQKISNDKVLFDIPIICIKNNSESVSDYEKDNLMAIEHGAHGFFVLPSHTTALQACLRNIMRLKNTASESVSKEAMSFQEMLPIALSTIMRMSNETYYIKDCSGRYICCSQAAARGVGMKSPEDVIGKTDYDFTRAEYADKFAKVDQEIMRSQVARTNYVQKIPAKDGRCRISNTSKYPIIGPDGSTIGIYGVSRDVTDEKNTEFELKTLLSVIPSGVIKYSADEKEEFSYINNNFVKNLGYTMEQFVKKFNNCFREMVWKDDRRIVENEILHQEDGGRVGKFEYRIEAADGTLRWFHDEGVKITDETGKQWYYVALVDVSKMKEVEEQLRVSREEYRLATLHSGRTIGRYDIKLRTLSLRGETIDGQEEMHVIYDVPYGPKQIEDISPDTLKAYQNFYQNIIDGKPEGTVMFKRHVTDGWRWFSTHSTTIFSKGGKPVSALISYIDVTDRYEKDEIYIKWQQSLENRPDSSYSLFRYDSSQFSSINDSEGELLPFSYEENKDKSFDECTSIYANKFVDLKDRKQYIDSMKAAELQKHFEKGKRKLTMEYREIFGGDVRWIRRTIDLVERPDATGIIAYLMYEDIDSSKKEELDIKTKAETDPLTGLLNRAAFIKRLNKAIENRNGEGMLAFFILDLDGFKQVNDVLGHAMGDQVIKETGETIHTALGDCDPVGRLGGDEFVFCMLNVPNKEVVRKKVRRVWKLTHRNLPENVHVSSSIGIAMCPEDGNTFEDLYRVADRALYLIKENGKDNYGFIHETFSNKHDK